MMVALTVLMVVYLRATVDEGPGALMARAGARAQAGLRRRGHGAVLRLALPADPRGRRCSASTTRSRCRPSPGFSTRWYVDFFHDERPDRLAVRQPRHRQRRAPSARSCSARCWRSASSGSARDRGRAIGAVTLLPLVTPEIVTGVAALLFFTGLGMKLSLATVILAEITFSIAYVTVIVRGRLARMSPEVEEAARDLGCTPWQAAAAGHPARRCVPALIAAGLLVFALVFDDFVLAFFTTGVDPQPLPVRIYSSIRFGVSPAINAVGTLMLAGLGAADRGGPAAAAPVQPHARPAWTSSPEANADDHVRDPTATGPAATAQPAVSLRGLTKVFGGTTVVDASTSTSPRASSSRCSDRRAAARPRRCG